VDEDVVVKKFTFAISSPDEFLVYTASTAYTNVENSERVICVWQASSSKKLLGHCRVCMRVRVIDQEMDRVGVG